MKAKNLLNQRFDSLLVVSKAGTKNNRTIWNCRCDCGKNVIVDTHSLTTGNTKSCGCKKYGNRKTHGEARSGQQSKLYRIWAGMKNRCNNKSHIGYIHYGAKGIKVCDEWNTYEIFKTSQYAKALELLCKNEKILSETLEGDTLKLFNKLMDASDEIIACSGTENFKMGFILGVQFMADCFKYDSTTIFKDI